MNRAEFKDYFVTYGLLLMNVLVFLYMTLRFGTTESVEALLATGANYAPAVVLAGQYWRWLTAAFIHIGLTHLLMNMISLYFMGRELESLMGHGRFLLMYLIAAIGGNLMSFAFSQNISAGASTALFGMFTSYLVLARLHPESTVLKQRAMNFTVLLLLNFVNSLWSSGIDLWGHLGGALFGAMATLCLGSRFSSSTTRGQRFGVIILMILSAGGLIYLGYQPFV